jgi:glycine/D-amino acid oxidase-like deaminating enzyme
LVGGLSFSGTLVCRGQTRADVIVYGATSGGFCAAIAAAREGASVILLEPTTHVGAMNTGGLRFSDSDQMHREQLMDLFHEWHLRIQKDYEKREIALPYDVNEKNQATWLNYVLKELDPTGSSPSPRGTATAPTSRVRRNNRSSRPTCP